MIGQPGNESPAPRRTTSTAACVTSSDVERLQHRTEPQDTPRKPDGEKCKERVRQGMLAQ